MVCVAADYVTWNEQVADFAGREEFAGQKPRLKLAGALSPRAREELTGRGWIVNEHAPFSGNR